MKLIVTLLMTGVMIIAHAQSSTQDTTKVSYLDEVVVSANRVAESRRTVPQQVSIINSEIIQSFNAQTSADLIQNSGVVQMQRSQQGGGSPMMRGFEASRVLLVVDGVRMNNLIYRAGHLQNIITMDNNVLDRAEILFGPSSTVYGSDALGGVIHFYTRNPELSNNSALHFSGNSFIRYGSVNNEKTGHIDFNLGGKKFGSLTSFTFSDFGDLRMGEKTNSSWGEQFGVRPQYVERSADNTSDVLVANSDPYVQKQSGYTQYDLLQKFLFKQSDRVSHTLNFQYSTSTDIPRYDRLTEAGGNGSGLRFSEWYYGPQKRLLTAYQLKVNELGSFADALTATLSYQSIEESRHDRRFNNNNRNDRIEKVNVFGLTVDFNKAIEKNQLRYGIDGQFNSVQSTAHITNIVTGAEAPLNTRYPDGDNTLNSLALYASHTLPFNETWTLSDGVRLGGSSLHSTFVDKSFFPFPYDDINQKNKYVSGNLGVIYTPTSWKISLMGSTGYRVPNVDDLAKVFESVTGTATTAGTLVVPNPDLKPEKTLNGDLSIAKFFGSKVRLEGTLFATEFYDAIVTKPTTFNGQPNISYGGFPANVYSSQNAARAYLFGYSVSGRFQLMPSLAVMTSYNYVKGRVKNENGPETPLDHIPPHFGRASVQYQKSRFRSEVFANFNGWKRLSNYSSSGEDNLQYATAEGMPSWWTLNVRLGYDINKIISVQAGVDNIFDLQYRQFASGINSPGRNISGTLRVRF